MKIETTVETKVTGATLTLDADEWRELLAVCKMVASALTMDRPNRAVCDKIIAEAAR